MLGLRNPRSLFGHPDVLRVSYIVVVCSIWLIIMKELSLGGLSSLYLSEDQKELGLKSDPRCIAL